MIRDDIKSNNTSLHESVGINKNQMFDFLPSGWQKFVQVIFTASELCEINIHTLDIKNGTLYVRGEGTYQDVFNRVARTIMSDSALTCMVCGNFGRRRKDQSGSPPLCGAHYLEYINEE